MPEVEAAEEEEEEDEVDDAVVSPIVADDPLAVGVSIVVTFLFVVDDVACSTPLF